MSGPADRPTAHAAAGLQHTRARTTAPPSAPHVARSSRAGEYVCTYCERGQCARCNDKACTCCYGNED